jgi:hypothetical protein
MCREVTLARSVPTFACLAAMEVGGAAAGDGLLIGGVLVQGDDDQLAARTTPT